MHGEGLRLGGLLGLGSGLGRLLHRRSPWSRDGKLPSAGPAKWPDDHTVTSVRERHPALKA